MKARVRVQESAADLLLSRYGDYLVAAYGEAGARRVVSSAGGIAVGVTVIAEPDAMTRAEIAEIDGAELVVWQELADEYRASIDGVRTVAAELIRREARDLCDADWIEELDDACQRYGLEDGVERWLTLWLTHLEASGSG